MLTDRERETLTGIFHQAKNLDTRDIDKLINIGFVYTEWSDYGYKLSDEGLECLRIQKSPE